MLNRFSTREGYHFEIRQSRLHYLGPVPLTDKQIELYEYFQMLFGWFQAEYPLPPTRSDDVLTRCFAHLLGAELLQGTPAHPN